jgi:hypothetical protein
MGVKGLFLALWRGGGFCFRFAKVFAKKGGAVDDALTARMVCQIKKPSRKRGLPVRLI